MALAYVKPGVTVSEISSPSFNPQLIQPTSVCIIGPAQGFQTHTEVFLLDDNHAVTLSATFPDVTTIKVLDGTNVTLAPFRADTPTSNRDYTVDTTLLPTSGQVTIARSMQTTIPDGSTVVVYFSNGAETLGNAHTDFVALPKITAVGPTHAGAGLANLAVCSSGTAPNADYSISGNGGGSPTIVWVNSATVLKKFQTVYVDYTDIDSNVNVDYQVQLNNLSAVALPANATVTAVKTAPGVQTVQAVHYTAGTTTDLDYIVTGTGATTQIGRSAGTTTIGGSADKLVVRVSYQATPAEYWLPTRCFSQGDVEAKYGSAFDSAGNIVNPVSYGASVMFQNGLNSVIVQALFTEGTPRTQPTGTIGNWTSTLGNLYNIEDLNVVVPLIATGGLTTNDGLNLEILTAVQNFVNYMALQQNQYVIGICGEDSTDGVKAQPATLQIHAASLGASTPADSMVLVSPGSFTFANPVTGNIVNIGGQYAACAVAGSLGRYPVQTPLTRKRLTVINGVNDSRTEAQKNADAASGLMVIESKRGAIQIRHAVTTATDSIPHRELNVVRGKHWMMANIQQNLDNQVIGTLVIDTNTAFLIQLVVTDVLEQMLQQGAVVNYDSVQVQADPVDTTAMQVRFSYLPAYPLNRVNVQFSVNNTAGVTFSTDLSQTSGI